MATNEKIHTGVVGERPWFYLIKQDQIRYEIFISASLRRDTMDGMPNGPLLHLLSPVT